IGALVARKTLMWPDASIEFVGTDALPALSSADVDAAPLRRLGAESSNSAFVLGDLFCKAYRRLREGVNPEWEMSRFLTESSRLDPTVPALGAIELMRGGGDRSALALVQAAMPNQGDGRQHTFNYLDRHVEDALTRAAAAHEPLSHEPYLLVV